MKKKHLILPVLLTLAFAGCKKEDPNTPAEFVDFPTVLTVTEELPAGTTDHQYQGKDDDGDQLTFSMAQNEHFVMTSSGELKRKTTLDSDTFPDRNFWTEIEVTVADQHGEGETRNTNVHVVNDASDDNIQAPVAPDSTTVMDVQENDVVASDAQVVLDISTAYDPDAEAGETLEFEILDNSDLELDLTNMVVRYKTGIVLDADANDTEDQTAQPDEASFTLRITDVDGAETVQLYTYSILDLIPDWPVGTGTYDNLTDNASTPFPYNGNNFAQEYQPHSDGQETGTVFFRTERNGRTYEEIEADFDDNPNGFLDASTLAYATSPSATGLTAVHHPIDNPDQVFVIDASGYIVEMMKWRQALKLMQDQISDSGFTFENWFYAPDPNNPYALSLTRLGILIRDSSDPNAEMFKLAQAAADYGILLQ